MDISPQTSGKLRLPHLEHPSGHAQKAPHLRKGHGIQAAHSTETVQAHEVNACRGRQVRSQVEEITSRDCRRLSSSSK